ncbi:MAG TPA: tetratricopeptide repeat protein [Caldimonas sp.]|nr:tetratricopeptide repeat protein [Caldimonas sp.]
MQTYSMRELQSMLGISRGVIAALVDAGFVAPARGERRQYRFSFQDLVLLRTAYALRSAQIPPRKILASLKRLKAALPREMPLTGLRISAVGNEVAVHDGGARRGVESGQLLFDFDVPGPEAHVRVLVPSASPPTTPTQPAPSGDDHAADAQDWFLRGVRLEPADPARAETAYRRALELDPGCLDACLNLGVLLGDAGRTADAIEVYRAALAHAPRAPLLHYNLAVALDDAGRAAEALACYATCLQLDPTLADAHYNAARLHERLGHAAQAIRHYNAYRRLQR